MCETYTIGNVAISERPAAACSGRPFPSVRRLTHTRRTGRSTGTLIAIEQRDDTVVVASEEARRLARLLMRAARRNLTRPR
jgi:hypothetical protein